MNKDIKIYTKDNIQDLKSMPALSQEQLYIYCILSSNGNIKIGKTTNIVQRIKSLSGSNGGGYKIVKIYVSPATYISSIEDTCHNHYEWCRIKGTEWFDGCKLDYYEVVEYIDSLFHSEGFHRCNNLRKKIYEENIKKNS